MAESSETGTRSFYEVLNVQKTATADEIRREYRRLALHWHPDRNKDPAATVRFQEINEAYSVLSDPEKRANYDEFGEAEVDEDFSFDFADLMREVYGEDMPFMFCQVDGDEDGDGLGFGAFSLPADLAAFMGGGWPGAKAGRGRAAGAGASRRQAGARARGAGREQKKKQPQAAEQRSQARADGAGDEAAGPAGAAGTTRSAAGQAGSSAEEDDEWVELPPGVLEEFMVAHTRRNGGRLVCTVCQHPAPNMDRMAKHFEDKHTEEAEQWAMSQPELLEELAAEEREMDGVDDLDAALAFMMMANMGMGMPGAKGAGAGGGRGGAKVGAGPRSQKRGGARRSGRR